MIESFISIIHEYLIPLGGAGVFAASVMEEVFAPIPSAVVIFTSGFLLVSGPISWQSLATLFMKVSIPAAVGVTVGSLFAYAIAYYAGKPMIVKWGKWFGLSWDDIEKMHKKFSSSSFDEMSLFVIRAIPVVPSVVISAFCGLVRFPMKGYLMYSFLGLLVRTTVLGFLGWQVGKLYVHYAKTVALFENIILIGLIAAAITFVAWKMYKNKKSRAI